MAFIVESGEGLPNATSYVSTEEAEAYHEDTAPAWVAAAYEAQVAALIKATRYVDGMYRSRFLGGRLTSTQALEWPRFGAFGRDEVAMVGIPKALKAAVCEAALKALTVDLLADLERGGLVKSEKLGPLETTYADNAPAETRYPAIEQAIAPVLHQGRAGQIRISR